MSDFLYGVHEFGNQWADVLKSQGKTGWTTTTHALGTNPNDRSGYDFMPIVQAGITPIARLNNGYNPVGTIPLVKEYGDFAKRMANFVGNSAGCTRWIIGNEPNLSIERPYGMTITPLDYATCFVVCRQAIRALGSHHQVIVGAVGPYNAESGDWIAYWRQVLEYVAAHGGAEGLSAHAYTRSSNPQDIVSDAKMTAPGYEDRYVGFRTYINTLDAVPATLRHLPVYMTEFNPLAGWENANTGVVQAAYAEINRWNQRPGTQKIFNMTLFRWPKIDDPWWIEGKQGVLDDLRDAAREGYRVPKDSWPPLEGSGPTPPPTKPTPQPPTPALPPRELDPRLKARGVEVLLADMVPGQPFWRAVKLRWLDTQEAIAVGPDHHILGPISENGKKVAGKRLKVWWPSGDTHVVSKENPHFPFNYDYGMSGSLREYGIRVDDGLPSEQVIGIGMGKDGNKNEHTSTWIEWEKVIAPANQVPEVPEVPEIPPNPGTPGPCSALLVHPVADARYRTPNQLWGGNATYYSQFKPGGVPLRGHNGLDFPTPTGTEIRAVDKGVVKEQWFDPEGFGTLVLLAHAWGESLYAHLSEARVSVGQTVQAGDAIGLSGDTGKVSGPHLHFGMRVGQYNRADGWGGYVNPLPYLQNTATPIAPGSPAPMSASLIDPLVAAAILEVESNGTAFGPGNKMVIRFEPHIAIDESPTSAVADAFRARFRMGSPAWRGEDHRFLDDDGMWKEFHGPINSHQQFEHKALEIARRISPETAFKATAMGMAQVMGFNAQRIGFPSAEVMYNVLSKSAPAQMMAFVNFVQSDPALLAAVNRRDYEKVAELYNGSGQIAEYAALFRAAVERLKKA